MLNRFSTRTRSIFTALALGLIIFIWISPVSKYAIELVTPPSDVKDITVIQKSKELDVSWKKNTEYSLQGYNLYLNNTLINKDQLIKKDVDNYPIYDLQNGTSYAIRIEAKDSFNKVSKSINYSVKPSDSTSTVSFNTVAEVSPLREVTFIACVLAGILFILNLWVLFFKVNLKTAITVAAFPSMTIIPYFILSISVFDTVSNPLIKIALSIGIAIGTVIISYMLMLTSNILNGSLFKRLPLEQAAKASQFIFGLISTYLILIYLFSSNLGLLGKLLLFLVFVIYFTYSSLSVVQGLDDKQIVMRVASIAATMVLTILVLSLWPIDSIYAILTIAVVYYILLNIALEIRVNIGRSIWWEYSVLICLVVILLLTNAVWGIRGTII